MFKNKKKISSIIHCLVIVVLELFYVYISDICALIIKVPAAYGL